MIGSAQRPLLLMHQSHLHPVSLAGWLREQNLPLDAQAGPVTMYLAVPINTHLDVFDDLIDMTHLTEGSTIQHVVWYLQKGSTLNYRVRLVPEDGKPMPATSVSIIKNLHFIMTGEGAHAEVLCTYLGTDNTQVRLNTVQKHCTPETSSSLTVRSVLDGKAKLVCNNMIQITPEASRTNAVQSNKNILLSPHARAVSVPQLEIEANDVTCKHGAATSSFDPEHLFYVQSRGLDQVATRDLLVQAFLG